jgi:WD40 repeat protein
LWDLQTRAPSHELFPGLMRISSYMSYHPRVFSADGKTLLLATDSTLRLFDTATGKERGTPGHRSPIALRFSGDGRTLFTTCKEIRCRWNVTPGKEPALLARAARNLWEGFCADPPIAHSADGRLYIHQPTKTLLCVCETATGRLLHKWPTDRWTIMGQFSPDAKRVLLWHGVNHGLDVTPVRLYEVQTGKQTGEFVPDDPVDHPVYSPDGRFFTWADRTGAVRFHDAVTGKIARTLRSARELPGGECKGGRLLFSPDGEVLIVTTHLRDPSGISTDADRWSTVARVFHVPSGREIGRFLITPETGRHAGPLSAGVCSPDNRLLAFAEEESGTIRLIELASGQVRISLPGHRDGVYSLAFSPDGKTLASGGEDNVVFLWDVTGTRTGPAVKKAGERELTAWWSDLAAEDAARAGTAITSFLRSPVQAGTFLAGRLHPVKSPDEKRLKQLVADLDAGDFKTREAASRQLARLGEQAEVVLRQASKARPSLEAQRRIKHLLDHLEQGPAGETLRLLRAIEVLEHLATPQARRTLEALAKGAHRARETLAAKAALLRLAPGRR